MSDKTNITPNINVTPLIDVLLVLLIIFMVISPLKPSSFKAKIPGEPKDEKGVTNPHTLKVSVKADLTLEFNNQADFGTVSEPQNLIAKLAQVFQERDDNGIFREGTNEVEKTVFLKAPRSIRYAEVAQLVDVLKQTGAAPIGLQIDNLE